MEIFAYLLIGLIVLIIYKIKKIDEEKEKQNEIKKIFNKNREKNEINIFEIKDYAKKKCLLTKVELDFYKLLKEITDKKQLILFTQVALYELINFNPTNQRAFNKIRYKTIDFVITDKDCNIKLCIELDDETHNRPDRIKRDKFINALFEKINTPLLRIPRKNCYNTTAIEEKIINMCQI